jgi:hypothetical protein
MALVEVWKNIRGTRKWFNRRRLDQWLSQGDEAAMARAQLVALATGGFESEDALFDQPIEKMMGQVQAAANMALDYPAESRSLFDFLARVPNALHHEDRQTHTTDRELWLIFSERVRHPSIDPLPSQYEAAAAAQARARLGNLVARKMDAFQNDTQYAWARWNQRWAVSIGTIILIFILALVLGLEPSKTEEWVKVLLLLPAAIVGGCVAPFAKDIVTKLAEVKK